MKLTRIVRRTNERSTMISLSILLGLGLLIPMPVVVESFHLDSSNSNNNNFVRGTRRIRQHQPQQHQQYTTLSMCICINCQLVTSCKAYHFVETKHEQPHMTNTPTFLPREGSPTINVNIRTEQNQILEKQIENNDGKHNKNDEDDNAEEDEIIKRQRPSSMWKDQMQEHDDADADSSSSSHSIITPAIHNNADVVPIDVAASDSDSKSVSKTTIEYDVVKCEDFILDKNCWIINMPEEIKRLNPDFVPS